MLDISITWTQNMYTKGSFTITKNIPYLPWKKSTFPSTELSHTLYTELDQLVKLCNNSFLKGI